MYQLRLFVVQLAIYAAAAVLDNRGKGFVIAYMPNQGTADMEMFITTSSNIPTKAIVTMPKYDPVFKVTKTATRGSIQQINIPNALRGICNQVEGKGVVIHSEEELTVYTVNKDYKTTDAFIAFPIDTLGMDYIAVSWDSGTKVEHMEAVITVAAVEDDTQVNFTIPASCGCDVGSSTVTVILNKYQTYTLCAAGDLTGTRVISTKPIAVFSGNKRNFVPRYIKGVYQSSDHLVEQLIPVQNWGKMYVTVSTPRRNGGDFVKIVAAEDNTVYTYEGGGGTLNANEFHVLELDSNAYYNLTANKGIMSAIFSKTFNMTSSDEIHGGDPAMSIMVPVALYAADYTFTTVKQSSGNEYYNYVSVIITDDKKSTLMLDGSLAPDVNWTAVKGATGYVAATYDISPGAHNIYSSDPTVVFAAMAFGNRIHDSYAYPCGMRFAAINTECQVTVVEIGDGIDNDCDGLIDEEQQDGLDDDGDGFIDEDLAVPPRVDGGWGIWGPWGSCSASCVELSGYQSRQRLCDNPAPQYNGVYCEGEAEEDTDCFGPPSVSCPPIHGNWGPWTSWSACAITCDSGVSARSRECDSPAPEMGGDMCSGDRLETVEFKLLYVCLPDEDGKVDMNCTGKPVMCGAVVASCIDQLYPCAERRQCMYGNPVDANYAQCSETHGRGRRSSPQTSSAGTQLTSTELLISSLVILFLNKKIPLGDTVGPV